MMASSVPIGDISRPVTKLTRVDVSPMDDSTKLRKNADRLMKMIIPVVRMVDSKVCPRFCKVKARRHRPRANAAMTPRAADTLAVAKPLEMGFEEIGRAHV